MCGTSGHECPSRVLLTLHQAVVGEKVLTEVAALKNKLQAIKGVHCSIEGGEWCMVKAAQVSRTYCRASIVHAL